MTNTRQFLSNPMQKQSHRLPFLHFPIIADQMKRAPEIGVNTVGADGGARALQKGALGLGQRGGFAVMVQQKLIEDFHQFGTAGIIDFPECGEQRGRPRVEKATSQADHFIDAAYYAAPRLTGTERDQGTAREIEIEDLDSIKRAISQLDKREVGRIQAEEAVCRNMHDRT